MVWRLKVGTRWVWVYLLLEFQSKPDKGMPCFNSNAAPL